MNGMVSMYSVLLARVDRCLMLQVELSFFTYRDDRGWVRICFLCSVCDSLRRTMSARARFQRLGTLAFSVYILGIYSSEESE